MIQFPSLPTKMEHALCAVLLLAWALVSVTTYWNSWPPDLSALYLAGRFYASGQHDLIYSAIGNLPAWQAELDRFEHPDAATFPYLYPPLWAVLAAPFSALPPTYFFNGFYALHITMIAASIILAYRVVRPQIPLYVWTVASLCLLQVSLILELALLHNQIQISVAFLIILSFERYKSGAFMAAGAALALAASLKLVPAVLGLIFLIDRRYIAALASLSAGLILLGASIVLAGGALHVDFLDSLQMVSGRVSIEPINWNLESLVVQIRSLITGDPLGQIPLSTIRIPKPAWVAITNYALLLGGIALLLHRAKGLMPLQLMGLVLISTLAAPLAWIYHYLTVLLLLPMVFRYVQTGRALAILVVFGAASSIHAFELMGRIAPQVHAQSILGTGLMIALFVMLFAKPLKPIAR